MIKTNKNNKGFTLIELLVIIAIIGILTGIVMTSLNGAKSRSRDEKRISDIKNIQLSLEVYKNTQGGKYPDSLETLQNTLSGSAVGAIPLLDPKGDNYKYIQLRNGGGYHIGAILENKSASFLNTDSDYNSSSESGGFDGSNDGVLGVFDMKK